MTTPQAAMTAFRRATQLVRAYRRDDVPGMNRVVAEMGEDNSGSDVLYALISISSGLLDRCAPAEIAESVLADLVIDYAAEERKP
jgi:hypothetical protein